MTKSFYIRNAHEDEESLLFGDAGLETSLIATIQGEFDYNGKRVPCVIQRHSGVATTANFMNELNDLFHFLQTDYMNGMLVNAQAMVDFCNACDGVADFTRNGKTYHGFETHTEDFYFYLCCKVAKQVDRTKFTIRCYSRKALIAKGIKNDDREI